MAERKYRVLVAKTEGGLRVAAGNGWTLLENTVRQFLALETNDDHSLGNIGAIDVPRPGFVGLAFKEED